MVSMRMVLDDVLLAVKNSRVTANQTKSVTIPGYATENGRKNTVKFDVSDKGADLLDSMIAKAEKECADAEAEAEKAKRQAWAPLLDVIASREKAAEASGTGRRKRTSEQPAATNESPEQPSEPHTDN